jgi:tripartite-type tricarboxylate transporter receptor subunit TctC
MHPGKAGGFLAALALSFCASAQQWPAKPVTMLVGYPPGGGVDIVARFLAEGLRERFGQPVVIENKPGAVGNIAGQAAARAAPDGYTLLFTANATHAANVHLFKSMPFDPVKDFTPVTTIASLAFLLAVDPVRVPVSTVAELTRYLKARPGKLSYASGSATGRIAMEMYQSLAGVSAVHIPYKATATAFADLVAGRVQLMFIDTTFGLAQVRGGKLRALAVTTKDRVSLAPDIPSMEEAGVAGYDISAWFALFLPANAPRDIVLKLAEASNKIMTSDKAREYLIKIGAVPFPGTPESLAKFVDSETDKWGRLVKAAGITPE